MFCEAVNSISMSKECSCNLTRVEVKYANYSILIANEDLSSLLVVEICIHSCSLLQILNMLVLHYNCTILRIAYNFVCWQRPYILDLLSLHYHGFELLQSLL